MLLQVLVKMFQVSGTRANLLQDQTNEGLNYQARVARLRVIRQTRTAGLKYHYCLRQCQTNPPEHPRGKCD